VFLIMTLLAAIITTAIWYIKAPEDKYKLGLLSSLFWGASIMWLIDHIIAFLTEGGEFFEINQDATLLGISTILIALLIWQAVLLISDPKGVLRKITGR
jgi:hypothetical protein